MANRFHFLCHRAGKYGQAWLLFLNPKLVSTLTSRSWLPFFSFSLSTTLDLYACTSHTPNSGSWQRPRTAPSLLVIFNSLYQSIGDFQESPRSQPLYFKRSRETPWIYCQIIKSWVAKWQKSLSHNIKCSWSNCRSQELSVMHVRFPSLFFSEVGWPHSYRVSYPLPPTISHSLLCGGEKSKDWWQCCWDPHHNLEESRATNIHCLVCFWVQGYANYSRMAGGDLDLSLALWSWLSYVSFLLLCQM